MVRGAEGNSNMTPVIQYQLYINYFTVADRLGTQNNILRFCLFSLLTSDKAQSLSIAINNLGVDFRLRPKDLAGFGTISGRSFVLFELTSQVFVEPIGPFRLASNPRLLIVRILEFRFYILDSRLPL